MSGRWRTHLVADEHLLLRAGRLRRVELVESECTRGERRWGEWRGDWFGPMGRKRSGEEMCVAGRESRDRRRAMSGWRLAVTEVCADVAPWRPQKEKERVALDDYGTC